MGAGVAKRPDPGEAGAVAHRFGPRPKWPLSWAAALVLLLAAGLGVRVLLWSTPGHVLDIDQFVRWVGHIATDGLGHTYDQNVCYPPVIAFIWWIQGALEPAFRVAADSSDPTLRALIKVPASLADLGIALAIAYWYRDRPRAAVAAAAVIVFSPTVWYVSAWWGQFESIYVLPAVLALIAARANRPGLVAVLFACSLMAKPQALPLVVPFAAWLIGTQGWRGAVKAGVTFGATCIALWLPFLGENGLVAYLGWVREYQDGVLGFASINAWNPWWLLQAAEQRYVPDSTAIWGPLTLRHVGFAGALLLSVPVFFGVLRRPSPERLALGLAGITLVAFMTLTTMHERYAYAALPFLLMACRWPAVRVVCAVFVPVFALNLFLIRPPDIDVPGLTQFGVVGPVIMGAITLLVILWTWQGPPGIEEESETHSDTANRSLGGIS